MFASQALSLAAHAKVNLALAVAGMRADGYHDLRSVFLRLELADTLTITDDPGSAVTDELDISGDPDCPVVDNLVLRAGEAFRAVAADLGVDVPPLRIRVTKRIPMAAGLAGGSTDAASMLRLLVAGYPGVLSAAGFRSLAARLGSDVPFFVDGAGAALVSGVGEVVEPLMPPIDPLGVLLCKPPVGASTPDVFRAWDEQGDGPGPVGPRGRTANAAVDDLAHLLRSGVGSDVLADRAAALRAANDLWLAAASVTPGLETLRDALELRLGRPVLLTGSGSTLFALYPSAEAAHVVAGQLRSEPSFAAVRIIATRSTGPHATVITSRRDP